MLASLTLQPGLGHVVLAQIPSFQYQPFLVFLRSPSPRVPEKFVCLLLGRTDSSILMTLTTNFYNFLHFSRTFSVFVCRLRDILSDSQPLFSPLLVAEQNVRRLGMRQRDIRDCQLSTSAHFKSISSPIVIVCASVAQLYCLFFVFESCDHN
jgi:hypothetical protein